MACPSVFKLFAAVVSLGILATPAPAATPAEAALHAARSAALAAGLAKSVDDCFNPRMTSANAKVRDQLLAHAEAFRRYQHDAEEGATERLRADARELAATIASFDEPAPFPARLSCSRNRDCLGLGFEGNDRYPRCLPVNGDKHANPQYRALIELLDVELPALAAALRAAAL
jgi:hypothetical protein